MKLLAIVLLTSLVLVATACAPKAPQAPVARVVPHNLEEHGNVRVDNYYWLRERENPEVLAYLEAENAHTETVMADTEQLQEKLFGEIKGRIKQSDESVPYLLDGYYYYTRHVEGGEYPIHCRKKGSLDADEEVLVDVNVVAEGHGFCSVRGLEPSPDTTLLAYADDTVGRRKYTLRFKNLHTGEMLPDAISDVTGSAAWANDNRTVLYTRQDPETLRSYQVYRHVLGTDRADDVLVYEEVDETFSVRIGKTKSKRFILVASGQTVSDEVRFLEADDPTGELRLVQSRERGLEYRVDHFGDSFLIRTNHDAVDFRLMKAPIASPGKDSWQEVIPHRDDVLLQDFEVFKEFLVVVERRQGLSHIRVIPWSGGQGDELEFGEPAYDAELGENPQFDTRVVRYEYSSLTTPDSVYDYDTVTREKTLMKQDEVLGDFDSTDYVAERLQVPARDGTEVPLSLVYRRGLARDGSNPLLLYGYGSYGYSRDASFDSDRLSLLDRGFVYAIAHVRGGQELGRGWYEDGKLLNKKNTFFDFIDCGRYLVDEGYTSADRLFARGGSAGGLLVGAVANMAPDLFAGILAHVPWVDVVTTMLDDDIPLTTSEYDEWGDPRNEQYYTYMLSYSPYDNVEAKGYPSMLVTTGLHDSQVQYFEPAKWVAKLRATKTDDNVLLLKTNMEAGHGGPTGRTEEYRETAFEYAFMLKVLGLVE